MTYGTKQFSSLAGTQHYASSMRSGFTSICLWSWEDLMRETNEVATGTARPMAARFEANRWVKLCKIHEEVQYDEVEAPAQRNEETPLVEMLSSGCRTQVNLCRRPSYAAPRAQQPECTCESCLRRICKYPQLSSDASWVRHLRLGLLGLVCLQRQPLLRDTLLSPLPGGLGLGTLRVHLFLQDPLALLLSLGLVNLYRLRQHMFSH